MYSFNTPSVTATDNPFFHLLIWVGVILISLGVFSRFTAFDIVLARSLLNTLFIAGLYYTHWNLLKRFTNPITNWRQWLITLLLISFFTVIRSVGNEWITGESFSPLTGINGPIPWYMGSLLSNVGIIALSVFLYINNRRLIAEADRERQEKLRIESELQMLRTHINPHFLFNVLNNIYSLASVGSMKTADTILQLSSLLRYVTYKGKRPVVALQEEIEQVEQYIALFQLRGKQPLDIKLSIDKEVVSQQIEPMLLIPLVENALKHGDFIINPNAFAYFKLNIIEGLMHFSGSNSYNPQELEKDEQSGVGLDNIRRRIALAYPDTAILHTEAKPEIGQFNFQLILPPIGKIQVS
ncbi:MAG: histidine kinase [Bacteroidota bacterium]